MRYFSLKALLLSALSLGFSLSGFAENEYWTEYGNQPVYVEQVNGRSKQTLKFVDYKDDMLVAQMTIDGNIAEMSLPVSESMVNTLRFNVDEMQKANQLIRAGNYSGAITVLRPVVYPLIKFNEAPEMFTQLHSPIRAYIGSLISEGELSEANDLLNRISLDKVDIKYSQLSIQLMNAYLDEGNFEAAGKIARELPKSGKYTSNMTEVVNAADALRGAGEYEAVIPLYQQIEASVPENVRKNVQMWLAYSLVLANRVDEASPMIDNMEEPPPNDQLFSLYKLLQGAREYRNGEYGQALDVLTRGFVRAQTSYIWVPEMLYLIGDCYKHAEDPVAARNVWSEITILYPDSPWAQRANESLSLLPPKPQPVPAIN
jgi:tetratricopeptide (TPR) repeat protein